MKKTPDHAKKVFEGVIFDVYHWDQEMFDGTTAVFEALKKRDTVTVLATVDNMIVLNKEEQPARPPFVALPGDICEKDEDIIQNAQRELLEETGYSSDEWQEWFTVDPFGEMRKIEWSSHFYIAKNCKKVSEQKLDSGEKIQTSLITFEEFLSLKDDPSFRNKELLSILTKASESEEEKQTLKALLGITT